MSNVLDINTYNNSKNGNTSSIIILSEHSQQQEQKLEKCHEMEALFSGLNNFFRDDDILKESEHSSELVRRNKAIIIKKFKFPAWKSYFYCLFVGNCIWLNW